MMSFPRRPALLLAALLALFAASAGTAAALPGDGPDDSAGGHGRHDRPFHLGPFEFPSSGNVSGGFAWDTNN